MWWHDLVAGKHAANAWWYEAGQPSREQVPLVYESPGVLSLETIAKQEVAGHNKYFNSPMTDFTNMDGMQNQIQLIYQRQRNAAFQLSAERVAASQANQADVDSRWTATQQDDDFDLGGALLLTGLVLTGAGLAGYGPLAGIAAGAEAGAAITVAEGGAFAEVAAAEAAFAAEVGGAVGASSGATIAAAGAESFVGPVTGTIEAAGVQASGAVTSAVSPGFFSSPTVIGVATGAGPFISTATGLPLPEIAPPPSVNPTVERILSGAKSAAVSALAPAVRALFGPKPDPMAAPGGDVAPAGGGSLLPLLLLAGLALVAIR